MREPHPSQHATEKPRRWTASRLAKPTGEGCAPRATLCQPPPSYTSRPSYGVTAMKTSLNAAVVLVLAALYLTGNARAQPEEAPATEPKAAVPPGIVVVPFLLPPRAPAP